MNHAATILPYSFCLTFDDGPDRDWTPRILDVLAQANARATFFVIGQRAGREPALLRRIAAQGHAVGNHTFSHRHPWTMMSRAARAEVRDGAAAISDILGQASRFYRAPHGRLRRCMSDEAGRCGQAVIGWDLSAIDWGPLGTAERIAARLQRARQNHIVLMHDGRNQHNRPDQLIRILPGFLAAMSQRGLQPAPLSN